MKNLILILAILLTSSSWAKSLNDCLDAECLRERATNFKAFLKTEEKFTNELGKTFPNSMLDKLVTNFVDEIRMDFNNANNDRETTLSQMKDNIRDNGIHAAFVDPAIVFMDMYASLGKKDKVQSMANIVNTLNPAIGDTLEKDFGIEIDRNYDPNFDAPKRQLNLPSNFNPTKREQSKDQFGGPRMGQFGNEFDGSLGAPEIDKENGMSNGLKPRMGNSGPGMNEGEMISPILANKLEQDKNSLLYSAASGVDTGGTKLCFGICGTVTGITVVGSVLSGGALAPVAIKTGLTCSIGCLGVAYSALKKVKAKEKVETPKPDQPRSGTGAPDTPEVEPEMPEINSPRVGGGDQPKADSEDKPKKGEDKPKKDEDKPKKDEDKPKKDEVKPKKGEDKPKKGEDKPKKGHVKPKKDDECKSSSGCKGDEVNKTLGRVRDGAPDQFDNMLNLRNKIEINFQDLQINFGRPQFGN